MKDLLETDKIEFEENGYIIKNVLANNDNFKSIAEKLKNDLEEILKKKTISILEVINPVI